MDPTTLAVVTSALTALATKVLHGAAGAAGKSAWNSICSLFDWETTPSEADLARQIAEELAADPARARRVVQILQQEDLGQPSTMVGRIDADKVVVVKGTIGKLEM